MDARHPGANHDSFVWSSSLANDHFQKIYAEGKRNFWLLGNHCRNILYKRIRKLFKIIIYLIVFFWFKRKKQMRFSSNEKSLGIRFLIGFLMKNISFGQELMLFRKTEEAYLKSFCRRWWLQVPAIFAYPVPECNNAHSSSLQYRFIKSKKHS